MKTLQSLNGVVLPRRGWLGGLAAAWVGAAGVRGATAGDEPAPVSKPQAPAVSLVLTKVTAAASGTGLLIRCDVILDNGLDAELKVLSAFTSALDGIELVVTDLAGRTLVQQSYSQHQSPHAAPRPFLLPVGETRVTLGFPIEDLASAEKLRVRLAGTLPGSRWQRILSTETLPVAPAKE